MAELIVGKYKVYPNEWDKCKELVSGDFEKLLKTIRARKRKKNIKAKIDATPG